MATPRYGRDRQRPHRRGVPGPSRRNPWYILGGGFCVLYLLFLVRWDFGRPTGSAPTEQLSNLRKASPPDGLAGEGALDVEMAANQEQQLKEAERARQIPIKIVLQTPKSEATTAPAQDDTTAPVLTAQKAEELEGRVPGMPVQTERRDEAATTQPVAAETKSTTAAAAVVPVVEQVQSTTAAAVVPIAEGMNAPEPAQVASFVPLDQRHKMLSGYDATMKFLESYQVQDDESVFLFFVCSDQQFRPDDWSEECVEAKKRVYDVLAKSPGRNKLVTVFAGSQKYWKYQNDFYNDPDLRVKGVPCLMRWEGHSGRTSGMLVQRTLYDEPFLRYLFHNTDQPDVLIPDDVKQGKQITTINGYPAYLQAMEAFKKEENPGTTFLMMVSGRFRNNNRPWCPYCRYSELPIEYAFYKYAPRNARMIRVEVTDSYTEWKHRNEFSRDPDLQMRIVPIMFAIEQVPAASPNASKTIKYTTHKVRYDELATLRQLFTSFT